MKITREKIRGCIGYTQTRIFFTKKAMNGASGEFLETMNRQLKRLEDELKQWKNRLKRERK